LGFAVSLAEIADIASYHAAQVDILGHLFYAWAFLLLFHALLFYVNRAMSERTSALGLGFSSAASLLVAVAARQFVPMNMIGTAWLVIAATLFEFGVRKRLGEFRWQAYVIAIAGGLHNLVFYKEATSHPWIALALTTAFAYAAAWRAGLWRDGFLRRSAHLRTGARSVYRRCPLGLGVSVAGTWTPAPAFASAAVRLSRSHLRHVLEYRREYR
jgi:hypothetical protein